MNNNSLTYRYNNPRRYNEESPCEGANNFFKDYNDYIVLCKEYCHVPSNRWEPDLWVKHYYHLKYIRKKSLNNQ